MGIVSGYKLLDGVSSFFRNLVSSKRKIKDYGAKSPYQKSYEDPILEYFETPIGNYFLPNNAPGDIVIQRMKFGEIFEPEVVSCARRYIKKNSVVLDVGANFGQMSLLFAKDVGPQGTVYSFEADDFIFDVLIKNIKANKCTNIKAIFKAVYNKNDTIMLYPVQDFKRFDSYGSYGLDPGATEGRKVQTITIDSLDIHEPISFMKVDVQGSDLFVLQGAVETIKRHKMPILFEYEEQFGSEFKVKWQDYADFIEAISYQVAEKVLGINYLIVPKK